jgi:hypothetical protein
VSKDYFLKMNAAIFTAWQPSAVRSQMSPQTFDERVRCALQFINNALPVTPHVVVVVDEYSRALLSKSKARVVFMEDRGAGVTRRKALDVALSLLAPDLPAALLWCEPEKIEVPKYFTELTSPVLAGGLGVVVPRRQNLDSYPEWQKPWEVTGNEMVSALVGPKLDYFFGSRVLGRRAAEIFLQYPNSSGVSDTWDATYAPLIDCAREGLRLGEVTIPFTYPVLQRASEERDIDMLSRRTLQLHTIISQMVTYAKHYE